MKLESFWKIDSCNQIKPGDFFVVWKNETAQLAIKVARDGPDSVRGAAILTDAPTPGGRVPAIVSDDVLGDATALVIRDAVIRPKYALANFNEGEPHPALSGLLLVHGENTYMRAARAGANLLFDVKTGHLHSGTLLGPMVWFSDWEIGIRREDAFVELFSFSALAQQQPLASVL